MIDYSDMYFAIRKELLQDSRRISTVRSWAIALAGGIGLQLIRTVTTTPNPEAIISDSYNVVGLILLCGSILTYFLWMLSHKLSESITVMGLYLLQIERQEGVSRGWEHYVWLQASKGLRSGIYRLLRDVMFWEMLVYSLAYFAVFLSHQRIYTGIGTSVVFALFIIGTLTRFNEKNQRKKIISKLAPLFDTSCKWDVLLQEHYKDLRAKGSIMIKAHVKFFGSDRDRFGMPDPYKSYFVLAVDDSERENAGIAEIVPLTDAPLPKPPFAYVLEGGAEKAYDDLLEKLKALSVNKDLKCYVDKE